ncbi:GNAT family N-acetyltransferase [Thalassotalea agarivorans]|uniref:Putative acetyltransferase n=1 Tax=Thalassotalea agarivorans TaxID=349064 RepID=A0A1I0EB97_THASX|nr:GNAT family N-acetyltransferase [Thalassotalea agarivorans]SET42444.1 putative acetyltransferase [Thalassotalea agarivorans]
MNIRLDDFSSPQVAQLLQEHLADMRRISPPESVHALDLEKLKTKDIHFWTAWEDDTLLACAAIKRLSQAHGEIKSMRVAQVHQGKGIASNLMVFLLNQAKQLGYSKLSLETGTQSFFKPAHQLYQKFGFKASAPFADYKLDPNSCFFTCNLSETAYSLRM